MASQNSGYVTWLSVVQLEFHVFDSCSLGHLDRGVVVRVKWKTCQHEWSSQHEEILWP